MEPTEPTLTTPLTKVVANFKDLSWPIQKYNFDSNSLMSLVMIWSWMYISHPSHQTPISSKIDPKLMLYRPLAKVKLTPI